LLPLVRANKSLIIKRRKINYLDSL
jgi:hypothetical protein